MNTNRNNKLNILFNKKKKFITIIKYLKKNILKM